MIVGDLEAVEQKIIHGKDVSHEKKFHMTRICCANQGWIQRELVGGCTG